MQKVGDTNRVESARHNASTNQAAQKTADETADHSLHSALEDPATLEGVEVAEKASCGIQMASHGGNCHRSVELVLRYKHLAT